MRGKFNRFAMFAALAAGLCVALPCSAAFAQSAPDIPGWILVDTKNVREWVPNPAKPGRGKWTLKKENDRKYFVADDQIGATEERSLDNSSVLSTWTEKQNEVFDAKTKDTTKYDGPPRQYDENGTASVVRRLEGRQFSTYKVWPVTTKKETKTYQKFDKWDEQSYDERTNKKLKNTYRVKKELTFKDPKTGQQMKARTESVQPPVEELAYGSWSRKGPFKVNQGKSERVVDTKVVDVGRRQAKELLSQSLAANTDPELAASVGGGGLAFSGDKGQGAGGASRVAGAFSEKLTGAAKATSKGGAARIARSELDSLYVAAATGLTLVDAGKSKWNLRYDGTALYVSSEGSNFRLPKGEAKASGSKPGTLIQIDKAAVGISGAKLSGIFKNGKGQPSSTLQTE